MESIQERSEEELDPLPQFLMERDPFMNACLAPVINNVRFDARVTSIDWGRRSRTRLYFVRYSDGDCQHMTVEEVQECIVSPVSK